MKHAVLTSLLPLLLLRASGLAAAARDTVLTGDGTPGPYIVGAAFIDTSTLHVRAEDSADSPLPGYTFVERVNGVLFAEPIDSGFPFRVRYRTRFAGLTTTHRLFEKTRLSPGDTSGAQGWDSAAAVRPAGPAEALDVSGYKSVGVSVGNLGGTNFEQAMDVTVFGSIAPETELRAHLSDQGSTLEGATRELSEVDMIYLALSNPRYEAVVGDQYARWRGGSLLRGQKKIKGISARYTPSRGSFGGFGALSGGTYTVEILRGKNGLQGPYFLAGNGRDRLTGVLGGTVSVRVNGEKLREGEQNQYVVDYDFGTVTFTPEYLIRDDDLIRVEYEYKSFDYQRALTGAHLGYTLPDSLASVAGGIWYEADNPRAPIDLELSSADRDSLARVGDSTWFTTMMGRPVDPLDADSASVYNPLYAKRSTAGGTPYFEYVDPVRTPVSKQLYEVRFRNVGAGNGEYEADSLVCFQQDYCRETYRYVGPGNGDYSSRSPVPSPARSVQSEVILGLKPAPWVTLATDLAATEQDNNLFSSRDDHDNLAGAARTEIVLGRRAPGRAGLWTGGRHMVIGEGFSRDILAADQARDSWNDTLAGRAGALRQSWETFAGARTGGGVSSEFTYGRFRRGSVRELDKLTNETRISAGERVSASYEGGLFRRATTAGPPRSRRNRLEAGLDLDKVRFGTTLSDEWWWKPGGLGRGHAAGGGSVEYKPLSLVESATYTSYRKGSHDLLSPDTGYAVLWKQRLNHAFLPRWRVSAFGTHHRHHVNSAPRDVITTLAGLTNDIASRGPGFSTRQEYRLSFENASVFVQEPRFVGRGFGSHTLDTTGEGDRFVSESGGAWEIREREFFSPDTGRRVRRASLELHWSYYPAPESISGILGDLRWRGTGAVEEHLAATEKLPGESWAPGYLSLADRADSAVTYAALSYRQGIRWQPAHRPSLSAGVSGRPFLRLVRRYREEGTEWESDVRKRWDRFTGGLEGSLTLLDHEESGLGARSYSLNTRFMEFEQRYRLWGSWEASVAEGLGWARRDGATGEDTRGRYYRVRPGLQWRPASRGWAEAAYTRAVSRAGPDINELLARGFIYGVSHVIDLYADIGIGEHFSLIATYRGEFRKPRGEPKFGEGIHAMSLEVKAWL